MLESGPRTRDTTRPDSRRSPSVPPFHHSPGTRVDSHLGRRQTCFAVLRVSLRRRGRSGERHTDAPSTGPVPGARPGAPYTYGCTHTGTHTHTHVCIWPHDPRGGGVGGRADAPAALDVPVCPLRPTRGPDTRGLRRPGAPCVSHSTRLTSGGPESRSHTGGPDLRVEVVGELEGFGGKESKFYPDIGILDGVTNKILRLFCRWDPLGDSSDDENAGPSVRRYESGTYTSGPLEKTHTGDRTLVTPCPTRPLSIPFRNLSGQGRR